MNPKFVLFLLFNYAFLFQLTAQTNYSIEAGGGASTWQAIQYGDFTSPNYNAIYGWPTHPRIQEAFMANFKLEKRIMPKRNWYLLANAGLSSEAIKFNGNSSLNYFDTVAQNYTTIELFPGENSIRRNTINLSGLLRYKMANFFNFSYGAMLAYTLNPGNLLFKEEKAFTFSTITDLSFDFVAIDLGLRYIKGRSNIVNNSLYKDMEYYPWSAYLYLSYKLNFRNK
jgi:hypothetical protein